MCALAGTLVHLLQQADSPQAQSKRFKLTKNRYHYTIILYIISLYVKMTFCSYPDRPATLAVIAKALQIPSQQTDFFFFFSAVMCFHINENVSDVSEIQSVVSAKCNDDVPVPVKNKGTVLNVSHKHSLYLHVVFRLSIYMRGS